MNLTQTLIAVLFSAYPYPHFLQIGNFGKVNSIYIDFNTVTLGTDGGVLVYDLSRHQAIRTLITENPVKLAITSVGNQETFFITNGDLYKIIPGVKYPIFLANIGNADALGIEPNFLWVHKGNKYQRYSINGNFIGAGSPGGGVRWVGKLNSVPLDDRRLNFLAPYFVYRHDLGNISYTVAVIEQNKIYVGTEGIGVLVYDFNTWQLVDSILYSMLPTEIRAIEPGQNGEIWFGGTHGLTVWKDSYLRSISTETRTEVNCPRVNKLLSTESGIYLATDCGLYLLQNDNFYRVPIPITLEPPFISIRKHRDKIWIASEDGWGYLKNGRFRHIESNSNYRIFKILTGKKYIYILTEFGLKVNPYDTNYVYGFTDSRDWLFTTTPAGVIYRDTVFIATRHGIVYWKDMDTTFHYLLTQFELSDMNVHDMFYSDGQIFLATDVGVYIYDFKRTAWFRLNKNDGLPIETTRSVFMRNDTLFVGTTRGLAVFW